MLDLDKRSITYLPGVGPKKADILQKEAGISSYEDLLFYFPYKYIDRSRFYKVAEISGNMPYIQLKGQILYFDTLGEGRSKRLVGKFSDGTGTIDLVWFKGLNYVTDKYRPNTEYIVFGKPTEFGHTYNIPHPDIDSMEQADQVANGLTPFYNTSEKMKKSFLNSRADPEPAIYVVKLAELGTSGDAFPRRIETDPYDVYDRGDAEYPFPGICR